MTSRKRRGGFWGVICRMISRSIFALGAYAVVKSRGVNRRINHGGHGGHGGRANDQIGHAVLRDLRVLRGRNAVAATPKVQTPRLASLARSDTVATSSLFDSRS